MSIVTGTGKRKGDWKRLSYKIHDKQQLQFAAVQQNKTTTKNCQRHFQQRDREFDETFPLNNQKQN